MFCGDDHVGKVSDSRGYAVDDLSVFYKILHHCGVVVYEPFVLGRDSDFFTASGDPNDLFDAQRVSVDDDHGFLL